MNGGIQERVEELRLRNCRNGRAESSVLANAQTGLRCNERSREARTEIEGNYANRASKDVTALRYQWVMTGEDGKQRKHTVSSDSYMVDAHHPVLGIDDRKLICWSATVDESLIEHVLRGGGSMVGAAGSGGASLTGVTSLRLEIDMLLFSDGEIAGPDTEKFAERQTVHASKQ